jgi:hypothetical protein
MLKLKK